MIQYHDNIRKEDLMKEIDLLFDKNCNKVVFRFSKEDYFQHGYSKAISDIKELFDE